MGADTKRRSHCRRERDGDRDRDRERNRVCGGKEGSGCDGGGCWARPLSDGHNTVSPTVNYTVK